METQGFFFIFLNSLPNFQANVAIISETITDDNKNNISQRLFFY